MNDIIYNDFKSIVNNLDELIYSFEGKHILITGHQGFLGSNFSAFFYYLNDEVLKQKTNITCIDNKIVDLDDLTEEFTKDFHVIIGDVSSDLPQKEFDYIIHCAGIASPTYYRKFPLETIYVNTISYWDILKKINTDSLKGFLYFSTSEIYGDPDPNYIPIEETYRGNVSTIGPRACYDESKRLGETISVAFAERKNIPIKIVRPFNVYGPFMRIDDKRVIPDFASFALQNKKIQIFSDGSPTRSFCYSSDALEGFLRALLLGKSGRPYNIGNGSEEISMLNLANLIAQIIGDVEVIINKSKDKHYLTDNPQRRCPSVERAIRELKYYPKISLKVGLERILRWYIEIYNL